MTRRGVLISFEGGEGSGKTTAINRLANRLRDLGYSVYVTREPGGNEISEMVREILVNHEMEPTTELLLYNGSRHEFVVKVVLPALEQYDYVITDRYYDSTTAYQGYGRGLELGPIRQIIGIAVDNLVPARTYLLDVDPEIGLVRATKPGVETNKFEAETMEFHQKVAEGYLDMASQEPERFTVIDANQEADAVFEDIFADFVEHFQITRGETR